MLKSLLWDLRIYYCHKPSTKCSVKHLTQQVSFLQNFLGWYNLLDQLAVGIKLDRLLNERHCSYQSKKSLPLSYFLDHHACLQYHSDTTIIFVSKIFRSDSHQSLLGFHKITFPFIFALVKDLNYSYGNFGEKFRAKSGNLNAPNNGGDSNGAQNERSEYK